MGKGLVGCRILITRAQHQAPQLAAQLEAVGAETISIPTIEIAPPEDWAPLDAAMRRLNEFDWLVLTSSNAVDALRQRTEALGLAVDGFAGLQVAVVGPATARAVEALGLMVALMPEVAVAEKLAEALRGLVAGKKVLLPQARGAREVLAEKLQRAGARLTVVEVYGNVVPDGSVAALRELFGDEAKRPHAIAFTSSSTALNFFALMEKSGIGLPQGVVLASIGPVTSGTLHGLGRVVDVEAEEHTVEGLVRAIGQGLEGRG